MRTGIPGDRQSSGHACGRIMGRRAAAAAALLLLAGCGSFWESDFWDRRFWGFESETGETATATARAPEPVRTSEATIKMCCLDKGCATVSDAVMSCNPNEIAKLCDENGEYCTSYGGPDFRER